MRERLVEVDVAHEVRPPAPARRLPKAITVDQVERLIDAAGIDQTPLAVRDRAMIELLYGTGARISEAVGLAVDDVDLDGRTVLLSGKGGKQRRVPLGSYAARAVDAYLVRVRPGLAAGGIGHAATVAQLARWPAVASVGLDVAAGGGRQGRLGGQHLAAHACAIRSRRTCSKAAPTCASCRNCSGIRR